MPSTHALEDYLLDESVEIWTDCWEDPAGHAFFVARSAEELSSRGYVLADVPIKEGVQEMVLDQAYGLKDWGLPPKELLTTYLGFDNKTKVSMLPPDDLSDLRVPPAAADAGQPSNELRRFDRRLTRLGEELCVELGLRGVDLDTRLNATVRVPFERRSEQLRLQAQSHLGANVEDAELVMGHLNFLERRVLCAVLVLACRGGTLALSGRSALQDIRLDPKSFQIQVDGPTKMARILIFRHDLFEYSYRPIGPSVALQTWFLGPGFRPPADRIILPQTLYGEQVWVKALSVRVPGGVSVNAGTAEDCARTLFLNGTDGAIRVPYTRFDIDLYSADDRVLALNAGKAYARHGSFCPDDEILNFDSSFFNMDDMEARFTSPAHRVLMEVGVEVVYDMNIQEIAQSIGIYIGDSGVDWDEHVSSDIGGFSEHVFNGWSCHLGASRVANFLGITGPVSVVDTACSSGLVAFHNAHTALQNAAENKSQRRAASRIDMAMPMGVNCLVSPKRFVQYSGATMLSSKGRCFTFDSHCDGFLRGESCAGMLLERSGADSDVHSALACSAATAVNQDGRSASLTAPHGPSQSMLIKQSLEQAGFLPSEVGAFECHGTGTALGDPIEVNALTTVVMPGRYTPGFGFSPGLAGSSKTNCGHGEAAAGMIGLCKCILLTLTGTHIPSNHLRDLNPNIEVGNMPCHFSDELSDVGKTVCISGVSSFGSGGTNARGEQWGRSFLGNRAVNPFNLWTQQDHEQRSIERWERVCQHGRPGPQPFDRVYIKGSWDGWSKLVRMRKGPEKDYFVILALPKWGSERFRLYVNDDDPDQVFYPVDGVIRGPEKLGPNPQSKTWLIGEEFMSSRVKHYWISFEWAFNWDTGEILRISWVLLPESDERLVKHGVDIDCTKNRHN